MPLRRSARIQQAQCDTIPERASKRPRHNHTAADLNTSRMPLTDVSNVASGTARTKSRVQIPTTSTRKTVKRTRNAGRPKLNAESRLRNEPHAQATPIPVTSPPKHEYLRKSQRTRTAQELEAGRIGGDKHSEILSTPTSQQAKRTSYTASLQMKPLSYQNHPHIEPTAFSSTRIKSRDPSTPHPTRDSNVDAAEHLPSLPKPASGPILPQRNTSPPPLYPEDEIQPVVSETKIRPQERRPKHTARPPSPPPLYPDDEIQPVLPKTKKQPAYGIRTKPGVSTDSVASGPKSGDPPMSSPTLLIPSRQPPNLPQSSSPLEQKDKNVKPPLLNEVSTAEQAKQSKPKSRFVKRSSDIPSNDQPRQKSPIAVVRPQGTTPVLHSELETQSMLRSQFSSRAPAPIHTYSKRRQNVQSFALPSRKSLGVRSRTSSGESPDSKTSSPYDSENDHRDDDEYSEDSPNEESDREDPALVSFIGQQRKLWDEIDNIDLEEEVM